MSPGAVNTEIACAGDFIVGAGSEDEKPKLLPDDVSQCVMFLLSTPFTVNVTDIIVKPVGERC